MRTSVLIITLFGLSFSPIAVSQVNLEKRKEIIQETQRYIKDRQQNRRELIQTQKETIQERRQNRIDKPQEFRQERIDKTRERHQKKREKGHE